MDQGLVGDGLADKAAVAAAARDKGDQGRSKLEDGGALKPMIGPEFAGASVTQNPRSGGSKDLLDLRLAVWRKMVLRAFRASLLEPQLEHPKSNAGALQILNAEAAELQGAAYPWHI